MDENYFHIKKLSVALLGAYPPPYGGVSVHIQRLGQNLSKLGIKYVIYDFAPVAKKPINDIKLIKHPFIFFLKFPILVKESIIHIHLSDWKARSLLITLGILSKKKIVITIHGKSLEDLINGNNVFLKYIVYYLLKKCDLIIAVNNKIKDNCLRINVPREKIILLPAFIPPVLSKKELNLSPTILEFINDHNPIISANASKIALNKGVDIYGIDLCVESCINLKHKFKNIGFIICTSEINELNYFNQIKQKIKLLNLENSILFITTSTPFYPILKRSLIFIRPTTTDGDALSIREALYFKVPVIASDCIERPNGVILFRTGDLNDLEKNIIFVLDNYRKFKKVSESMSSEDNSKYITNIYKSLIPKI